MDLNNSPLCASALHVINAVEGTTMNKLTLLIVICSLVWGCSTDDVAVGPNHLDISVDGGGTDSTIQPLDAADDLGGENDAGVEETSADSVDSSPNIQPDTSIHLPQGCTSNNFCDDGNVCTQDVCQFDGSCKNVNIKGCCASNSDCDDGNPCTHNGCAPNHVCYPDAIPMPQGTTCTDGESCFKVKYCNVDTCWGYDKDHNCDDGNECTQDMCAGIACKHFDVGPYACDDGNPCTTDTCLYSSCKGEPLDCSNNDSNPCIAASKCDPAKGHCVATKFKKQGTKCGDVPCFNVQCNETGDCNGYAKQCNDKKPCTKDLCNGETGACEHIPIKDCCSKLEDCGVTQAHDKTGCLFTFCDNIADLAGTCTTVNSKDGSFCLDGDMCNGTDHCEGGKCLPDKKVVVACDDGNSCTKDYCIHGSKGGCKFVPVKNFTTCNDGDKCNTNVCVVGTCKGAGEKIPCSDKNPCTKDYCDSKTGKCEHIPIKGCCTKDAECNDKESCSIDKCNVKTNKCEYDLTTKGCCKSSKDCKGSKWGKYCQTSSFEELGFCQACTEHKHCGMDKNCTWGVAKLPGDLGGRSHYKCLAPPCKDHLCSIANKDAKGGCYYTAKKCDDGNNCTNDYCSLLSGQCVHEFNWAGKVCAQGKSCKKDSECDIGGEKWSLPGCFDSKTSYLAYGLGKCFEGKCSYQFIKNSCNDNNPCTKDVCGKSLSQPFCSNTPIPGCKTCTVNKGCDDKDPCTKDTCEGFACKHEKIADCTKCTFDADCTAAGLWPYVCKAGTCYKPKKISCESSSDCKKSELGGDGCGNWMCNIDNDDPKKGMICLYYPTTYCVACKPSDDAKCQKHKYQKCDAGGKCINPIHECQKDGDCDDKDASTTDYCEKLGPWNYCRNKKK
jgi:hypothetical protein